MARVVVVLVLERVFVVGGEVVAATTRVLAGRDRDLDQISVAINQETVFGFRFANTKRPEHTVCSGDPGKSPLMCQVNAHSN
jgi:hypothetical protein